MKYYYDLIINGYLQKTLQHCETKDQALKIIAEWKADGRLTAEDKVVIKTTIVIEDEIKVF